MYTDPLVSPTWIVDSIRAVRDALQSFDADKLIADRDRLAAMLSEAVGGMSYAARAAHVDDFEEMDPEASDPNWPTFAPTGTWEPTPDEVLAAEVPALCGGSPDASEDWEALAAQIAFDRRVEEINDGREIGGRLREADVRIATGAY